MSLNPGPQNFYSVSTAPMTINGQPLAGGFSANLDLGPNVNTTAQGAYAFVQSALTQQQGFLQQSLAGSQTFLAHQIAPILQTANQQIQQNSSLLAPGGNYFSNLNALANNVFNLQSALTAESITAQQAIAQSSAQAAQNSGGGGGGCFITTAMCEFYNKPDDCDELETLRGFRDEYMLGSDELKPLVQEYYIEAPKIVDKLNKLQFKRVYYRHIADMIRDAVDAVKMKRNKLALKIYSDMFHFAKQITGV